MSGEGGGSGLPAPDISQFRLTGQESQLAFAADSNSSYRVESASAPGSNWNAWGVPVAGTGAVAWVSVTETSRAACALFRVAIESSVSFPTLPMALTNGVTVSVPVDWISGVLSTARELVVELVDTNGVVWGQTRTSGAPADHVTNVAVQLSIQQDLPWGDHDWILRAYVVQQPTGTLASALARYEAPVAVQVWPAPLHAEGYRIDDPLGRPVSLRGVNLGAWLVYEGWMTGFAPAWMNEFAVRTWLQHKSLGGHLYPVYEAERCNASQGITFDGSHIGYFDAGDWFMFSNLVFESGTRGLYLNLAVDSAGAGHQIEVRLGNPSGPLLGALTTRATGGYFTWNRQYLPFAQPLSGTNDLYFVAAGGGGVANVDWFGLDLARHEAEACDALSGVSNAWGSIQYFDGGDWFVHSNVNFGVGSHGLALGIAVDPAFAGQSFEIRLDSLNGALAGVCTTRATTGWTDYRGQFASFTQSVAGVHDVYFRANAGAGIANIDWFKVSSEGLIDIYRDAFLTERDLDGIAAMGYNAVRLPFPASLLEDEDAPLQYKQAGWRLLDTLLDACRRRGLYVILGLHAAPGGQNPFDHNGQKDNNAQLWEDFTNAPSDPCGSTTENGPCYRERTEQLWRAIALRYRDHPVIAGYGLLNEPVTDYTTHIAPFTARLYDAIRAVGDDHLIMVMNQNFGQSTAALESPTDMFSWVPAIESNGWHNVVYEFHPYRFILDTYTDTDFETQKTAADELLRGYEYLRHFRTAPILAGEFMPGSRRNFDYFTRLFNAADLHWTHWSFKAVDDTDWSLSHRVAAWDEMPNLDVDDAPALASKLASYGSDNYESYDLLKSVLAENAGDTNPPGFRTEYFAAGFAAPSLASLAVESASPNGGFELDGQGPAGGPQLAGWEISGQAARTNKLPRGGARHAWVWGQGIAGASTNASGIAQRQSARVGQIWRGAIQVVVPADHPTNSPNRIRLQLEFFSDLAAGPADFLSREIQQLDVRNCAPGVYQSMSVTAEAPADTRCVKLSALYEADPSQEGGCYFDDASLQWLEGAGTHAFLNSGFESGLDHWTPVGPVAAAAYSPHAGAGHAVLWGPGAAATNAVTGSVEQVLVTYVRAGEPWRAEVFAKPESTKGNSNEISLALTFYSSAVPDASNAVLCATQAWPLAWLDQYKYNPVRLDTVAPVTGTIAVKCVVGFLNQPSTAGAVLIDDAALIDRSGDRPNLAVASNHLQIALNGGAVQARLLANPDAEARFELRDPLGAELSLAVDRARLDHDGAASVTLGFSRDACARGVAEYDTQGIIARAVIEEAETNRVRIEVFSKNWGLDTLGTLLFSSPPAAFDPSASLSLFANDATVRVRYGNAVDWTGAHGLDLSGWERGAVGFIEVEDLVAGGSDEGLAIDSIRGIRPEAVTRSFDESFSDYPTFANFREHPQKWRQSDDQSFANSGQWLWKPANSNGATSWLDPRWDYFDPARIELSAVAEARAVFRNFHDWDAVARLAFTAEPPGGELDAFSGPALWLELSRNGPVGGRMWFRLFRQDEGGSRAVLGENNALGYVDGGAVSFEVSANAANAYYGSNLLFHVLHGMPSAESFPDGLYPHLEFRRAAQDFLFLDDVHVGTRLQFGPP